jgi:hypothetical protein
MRLLGSLKCLTLLTVALLVIPAPSVATIYECEPDHNYLWWPDFDKDSNIGKELSDNWKYSEVFFDDETGTLSIGMNRVMHLEIRRNFNADGSGEAYAEKSAHLDGIDGENTFLIRRHKSKDTFVFYFLFLGVEDGASGTCKISNGARVNKY